MHLCLTTYTAEQQTFDCPPSLYQTLTINLPGRQISFDFQSGQLYDRDLADQEPIMTLDIVEKFKNYQRKLGRAKSTIASYQAVLIPLAEYAPEWPPSAEAIDAFLDGYAANDCSRVTLAGYWKWLNTYFKWAQYKGHIDINPMKMVPRREMVTVEATVINPRDFVKVIKWLQEVVEMTRPRQRMLPYERAIRDLAIIRFTYATGCRAGEVVGLRLRDLHLVEQRATIRGDTTKSKKHPEVYFGRQAQHALRMWLDIRPDIGEQIFLGTRGNGWSQKSFTPSGLYRAWRRRQQEAGIGPYRFHEIRHSHITHSMDNGIPIHHISHQAGHSSPDITLRIYTHSKDPERKKAYEGKNPDDTLEA